MGRAGRTTGDGQRGGQTVDRQEKEAGADSTRSLTEDEPAPQTIYYRPGGAAQYQS